MNFSRIFLCKSVTLYGLHQAEACTKRMLAPSRGLHQAEACTKQRLAPSGCLHQADACTKQMLAPSRGLHQAGACTKRGLAPSRGLHQAGACTKRRLAPSKLPFLWAICRGALTSSLHSRPDTHLLSVIPICLLYLVNVRHLMQ